jgi:hypothetical protein
MKKIHTCFWIFIFPALAFGAVFQACTPGTAPFTSHQSKITPTSNPSPTITSTTSTTPTPRPSPTPEGLIPAFDHVVIIIFENKELSTVIGSSAMPNFNRLAKENTLLTQHYAIMHPSLPNYLALVGGDTFGIKTDCVDCTIPKATTLMDEIEASGRTWKTYQEHMPEPCFLDDTLRYARKHNPFIYFESVRGNPERCRRSVVPLTDLDADLANHTLPNYVFITPDLCNTAHDCEMRTADNWLAPLVKKLQASPEISKNGLIILTWDEGQGEHTCCNLPTGGGRVATVLISSHVKKGFQDAVQYTHYSILKTILYAWNLPDIGHTADPGTNLIVAPWKK